MGIKKIIKNLILNVVDGFDNKKMKRGVKNEFRKFKDPRRVWRFFLSYT